ncbi:AzlC family ABC transporter permease [Calidifontibacillus erzurumensis]|uniref:AzlC family ABC transporter permease n=1 Tax=Calidifontibacillus erzurumensis TaxID=2741433 RepID=UPI0018AD55C9|nr:AzlC family ABC transporter permease [Calidifontibacillus erzurumensis]
MRAVTVISEKNHLNFKAGLQDGITIGIGYLPVALTFGLLAKSTGLSLGETILMSMIVYAGAAQYISLNLIALGTGPIAIIITTFIVNIRHFLMTASLNEKVEKDHPFIKAIYAFGITDETFSLAATKEGRVSTSYMFGLTIVAYGSWVINSGIGHFVGASLPEVLQESMAIALYAMFIGLLVPPLKKERKIVYLAVFAALLNCIFTYIFPPDWSGWAIVISTLLSAVGVEMLAKASKGVNQNG